jgi:hypothetical protein
MKAINKVINAYVNVYKNSYRNVYREKKIYIISYLLIRTIPNTKSFVTIRLVVIYKACSSASSLVNTNFLSFSSRGPISL